MVDYHSTRQRLDSLPKKNLNLKKMNFLHPNSGREYSLFQNRHHLHPRGLTTPRQP